MLAYAGIGFFNGIKTMIFKEYKYPLNPTEVAILRKDGKEFVVSEINAEGGVCDCCSPDWLAFGVIGEAELIMVKDALTNDIVFEP